MRYKIEIVEGIGMAQGERLKQAGVEGTGDLLRSCATPQGRRELSLATGLSEELLLKWANLVDLMRVTGVGKQFSELLEAAGVDTVKELRHRDPANLTAKLKEVNAERRLIRATPSPQQVHLWIKQAKTLKPTIKH